MGLHGLSEEQRRHWGQNRYKLCDMKIPDIDEQLRAATGDKTASSSKRGSKESAEAAGSVVEH